MFENKVRKSGLQLLLESMGIKLDPAELMIAFEKGKEAIPQIAERVNQTAAMLDARLTTIETKLDGLATVLAGAVSIELGDNHDGRRDDHSSDAGRGDSTVSGS